MIAFLFAPVGDGEGRWANFGYWLEDAMMALVWGLCAALPVDAASQLGYWLMAFIGPRLKKSKHVRANLELVRPDLSAVEIDALVRDTWGGYGRVMAEYPHLSKLVGAEADERLEVHGQEIMEKAFANGRTAVCVPAHLANWEVPTVLSTRVGFPTTVVHSPLRNPRLAARMEAMRSVLGVEYLSKHDGLRGSLRRLRAKRWVAILPDVRIDTGYQVRMFDREVPTTLVPARLALSTDSLLFPIHVVRTRGARFRITIHEPIEPDESIADPKLRALDMMQRLNDLYTEWIRENPSQWLCVKRRAPKAKHLDGLRHVDGTVADSSTSRAD